MKTNNNSHCSLSIHYKKSKTGETETSIKYAGPIPKETEKIFGDLYSNFIKLSEHVSTDKILDSLLTDFFRDNLKKLLIH